MNLNPIKKHIEIPTIIKQVNQAMEEIIGEDLSFFKDIRDFTINSGGKRVRSVLTCLLSHSFGRLDQDIFDLSGIIEIIHAASLLHDDVLDDADERRGKKSGRKIFGNKKMILAGDYLLACAMKRLNQFENKKLMDIFTDVIRQLSVAEILQMENSTKPTLNLETYMHIIYGKTASLFEKACQAPAILNNLANEDINKVSKWGRNFGYLFQMRDDYLDYFYPEVLKKKSLQDYSNGQITWPFLIAASQFNVDLHEYFPLETKVITQLREKKVLEVLHSSGTEEFCRKELTERIDFSLDTISSFGKSWEFSMIIQHLKKLKLPEGTPLGRK